MPEVQKRVVRYIEEIASRHARRLIVLVTHAEIIRAALLYFMRRELDEYRHLAIAPGSISRLELKTNGPASIRVGADAPVWTHCT
ncbi:MAG: phosphoglycerate mutase [Gammaproteobacteria bacterium]|nr:phosphoglycerate mutase [Gammaproteobacteria bacterium]